MGAFFGRMPADIARPQRILSCGLLRLRSGEDVEVVVFEEGIGSDDWKPAPFTAASSLAGSRRWSSGGRHGGLPVCPVDDGDCEGGWAFRIGEDWRVRDARVVEGPDALRQAALETVDERVYEKPNEWQAAQEFIVPVRFFLSGGVPAPGN